MATPRVSVLLTVYKRTEFLAEAIASVLAQTYRDFELIVADDSGTGAARSIVRQASTPQVVYLAHERTVGVVESLKRAARRARGDYLAILNDDDAWDPLFLSKLVAPLDADSRLALSFSDHWVMNRDGAIDRPLSEHWSQLSHRATLAGGTLKAPARFTVHHGVPLALCCVFRARDCNWTLLDPQVGGAYDFALSCLLAATERPFFYVPERLARYRMHDKMETFRRSPTKGEDLAFIHQQLVNERWFPELNRELRSELAYSLLLVGLNKLEFSQPAEARQYFWRCLRTFSPRIQMRAAGALLGSFARRSGAIEPSPAETAS